ncbi:hypothetical protein [Streptomyces canus]|uniref:hypothetical protein n=1 Tax=Streptomyces canus TaxID=58343 RepID=UPI00225567A5|nr:hypothetical protein [Streptomyces canus]MCX4858953.1 hypothetical protein [Streptomyces canus]
MGTNGPTISGSAAIHAARIRERDAQRAAEPDAAPDGKSTAQLIAEQVLPGYRADEEARERARLSELRARGVISADPEPEDIEEEDAYEEPEEVVEEDDEEEEPTSTAELYAARERLRIKAERAANQQAWAGSTWSLGEQTGRLVR